MDEPLHWLLPHIIALICTHLMLYRSKQLLGRSICDDLFFGLKKPVGTGATKYAAIHQSDTFAPKTPCMKKEKRSYAPLEIRICGDQLITKDYLEEFKEELLSEIGRMLKNGGHAGSPKWLKSEEVKKLLNVSAGTLQTMRRSGNLPYTKIGGLIYYNMDDIHRMLDGPKQGAVQKEGSK